VNPPLTSERSGGAAKSVRAELSRILSSAEFKGSQRCCGLLEYSVEKVLEGSSREDLKERSVGIEVFKRHPDYETTDDPVVRVAANEVRKRLAQFYQRAGASADGPAILLPPGSYAAEFSWTPTEPTPGPPAVRGSFSRLWMFGIAGLLVSLGLVYWGYHEWQSRDVLSNFWSPLWQSEKPVLVVIPQPLVYRLAGQMTEDRTGPAGGQIGPPEGGRPAGSAPSGPPRFLQSPYGYVGAGDASAMGYVAHFLGTRNRAWHLRVGGDASPEEMHGVPMVLIGAYSNPWTRRLTQSCRFTFEDHGVIRDRTHPGREWKGPNGDYTVLEDYALVSRFWSAETGASVVLAAGVNNAGTQVAGEFATDPQLLRTATHSFPAGWQHRNVQFVLYTKMVGRSPSSPIVLASQVW
jgi:hypothetical protein